MGYLGHEKTKICAKIFFLLFLYFGYVVYNKIILIIENKYMIFLVVGFGSLAFHMTLLYEMQLFDELPMVWGTCYCVYCL